MKLPSTAARSQASEQGKFKMRTALGENPVIRSSDRGSIPLASTICIEIRTPLCLCKRRFRMHFPKRKCEKEPRVKAPGFFFFYSKSVHMGGEILDHANFTSKNFLFREKKPRNIFLFPIIIAKNRVRTFKL